MTGAVSDPKKKKKKRKKKESLDHKVKRVGVALGIFFVVMLLDELGVFDSLFGGMSLYVEFVLYLAPWWVAGHDVLLKAAPQRTAQAAKPFASLARTERRVRVPAGQIRAPSG